MVITILLLLLIVLVIAAMQFFLFSVFIPSLKAQQVDEEDPVFSKAEMDFRTSCAPDSRMGLPSALSIPPGLLADEDRSALEQMPRTNGKVFSFWQKCYTMLHRK